MANNRMALVCKECNVGIAIAKFYPIPKTAKTDAGWYTSGDRHEQIDDFFIRHNHKNDSSMVGGSQYFLGYESDGLDWQYEKIVFTIGGEKI